MPFLNETIGQITVYGSLSIALFFGFCLLAAEGVKK